MVDRKIVQEWLEKADEDFLYASASLDEGLAFFSKICFHFQQSAEKYLKAYIVAFELEFRKIHDLIELLKICQAKDQSLSEISEACIFLNRYYIETRYPVHWPVQHTREAAEEAKKAARKIADFIKKKLSA